MGKIKSCGAENAHTAWKAMLDYVREGDTLYIESISRLGRSTKDLLNIIDTLTEKGVTLISHKENRLSYARQDTDTPTGKFMSMNLFIQPCLQHSHSLSVMQLV